MKHFQRTKRERLTCALPVLLALCAAGCGSSSGTVTGKVTLGGKPVTGGSVLFYAEGKESVTATIGEDGSYAASRVPLGPVKIAVETESARPAMKPPASAGKMMPPDGQVPKDAGGGIYGGQQKSAGKYMKIPEKYKDLEQSGLSLTVKGGTQAFDIKME